MSELAETSVNNIRTVEGFLYALQDADFDAIEAAFDDDLVYQNVGFSKIRGGRRTVNLLRKMDGKIGFEVKVHRIAADGSTVLTERTDALIIGPFRMQFWACGTFEVRDGRITLWRDYIDAYDMLKAALRGVLAIAIPPLRTSL